MGHYSPLFTTLWSDTSRTIHWDIILHKTMTTHQLAQMRLA